MTICLIGAFHDVTNRDSYIGNFFKVPQGIETGPSWTSAYSLYVPCEIIPYASFPLDADRARNLHYSGRFRVVVYQELGLTLLQCDCKNIRFTLLTLTSTSMKHSKVNLRLSLFLFYLCFYFSLFFLYMDRYIVHTYVQRGFSYTIVSTTFLFFLIKQKISCYTLILLDGAFNEIKIFY